MIVVVHPDGYPDVGATNVAPELPSDKQALAARQGQGENTLASVCVNPGGRASYTVPLFGKDKCDEPDELGQQRHAIKGEAKGMRRSTRYASLLKARRQR